MSVANSDLKFPAIHQSGSRQKGVEFGGAESRPANTTDNSNIHQENARSPFKLPTDDEVFYYRDKEKDKVTELKKNSKNLKIWDKKTASTQNALKNFKHFGHPQPRKSDSMDPKQKFSGGAEKNETALITEAISIVLDRKKQRDNLKHHARNRETMADVVAQKKEIFLVTMTTQIIHEERIKLSKLIDAKKAALNE